MIEKIMKAVKRGNKKRSRNITIGAVIGFLLSCTAVMGADSYLWIKGDSGKIQFNTIITDDENGTKGNWKEENPYSDNNWNTETKTYINNITLSSSEINGKDVDYISYGLRLSGNLTDMNFINNGSIIGTISSSANFGYGIYNSATMGNIENKGTISGTGTGVGYGIENKSGTMGVITNTGEISGSASGSNTTGNGLGYGIDNSGTMEKITNTGVISGTGKGTSYGNGNGFGIDSGTMGAIENTGIISGTGIGTSLGGAGEGYGIYNELDITGAITNTGLISGTGIGTSSGGAGEGYGIRNYSSATMGNITNEGVISGIGTNSVGAGEGYGINNGAGTMGAITNEGVISGYGTSSGDDGTGTGIYNSGTMGDIENTGLISGSGNSTVNNNSKTGTGIGIHNSISNDKQMGKITNIGIINGYGDGDGSGNGYGNGEGYGINNESGIMGAITNIGVISGYGSGGGSSNGKGYGINNKSGTIGDTTNTGVISGYGSSGDIGEGYGIYNLATMKNITNTGIISGDGSGAGTGSGYGIHNGSSGTMGTITNTGVIYGKTNAIKNEKNDNITVNNYGILVNGSNNDVISNNLTLSNNYGLTIKNEGEDITVGTAGTTETQDIPIPFYDAEGNIMGERKVTIENVAGKNDDKKSSFDGNKENHILNALTNTYKVTGENDKVTGSIINAYGTAVVFEGENKQLTLSGTIVNGGIDNSAAISGSDNADNGDTLILQSGMIKSKDGSEVTQNTIVNGNIDMKDGSDKLTVGSGTIINGNIDMGAGDDELDIENGAVINGKLDGGIGTNSTLNFNSSTARTLNSDKINIVHSISNFKNMNINTNVTLFEKTIDTYGKETDLKVTGADEIKIGENGTLTLRIDSTNKDNLSGKIIGHALYENTGEISSTDGGKLLLALNGAGNENIISFGSTTLGDGLVTGNGGTLGTTSALHTLERIDDKEVKVIVKQDIPDFFEIPEYEKLNKIYHGILSVEDLIANFNVEEEQLSTFLGYLNDIYAGNPYSYSSELSRKSVGMFRDIAVEGQFKPELNKWLIMGGLTHVDGGTKDTYYGKGYYTYDIGSSDMDADTKITGAYMLGEYGVSDTLTYGVLIGGNKLKSDLSNGSKVDGDALYMGAYAKKYIGNLKVTGGLGLQYGDYDADRFAAGRGITETRSYSDNYNDMSYDIYLNGRYSYNIGNNLFLEPYGTLSYTYIKQDSADEGNKVLAIETDSKSFDYTAAKVGVDLKKVIPHEKGKSTLSAGVSYTRLLNGADKDNITGRFKGKDASDFDILVAHKNENSIGLNAKYTLELESGILFDVKGSYSLEKDSHNGTGKNRNKGEWIVGAGIGYKF
ncbi:MAG: autotransporter domain-containing protein [Fusobacterium varium]|uniref:autotransporter domain-containing protein n=1 Tax=Fusobacterium varium TaxID=856 RepID=UPI00242C0766|nr:autotransporter outer membrane beta-barrel domain-containing protein [Fusobacterium varium]UYI78268.1 MAG: autotransporter domain-containing protein [Fusobacterium varium]